MYRLPLNLRQKWRDVADTVTERQEREVTVSDVASFVEEKARILTHPIFGDISSEPKGKGGSDTRKSTTRRVSSFAADAHNPDRTGEGISEEIPVPRFSRNRLSCPLCKSPHWLSQCNDFRTKGVSERYEFVREKELCYNCLVPGQYAVVCLKTSFCKVDGCHDKHSTFLHPPSARIDDAPQPETGAQSAYVSVGKLRRTFIGAGTSVTGLPVVPVKVRAKGGNALISTYAFLDGGSNTTFCSDQLLGDLGVRGVDTTLSLTTMERENSKKASSLVLTRRGLLSVVCSLYDPLGFVAPVVLPAKVILQDLCRKRLEWDDPIPDDERNRWLSWLEDLQRLEQLSVDRCLKPPSFGKVVSVQLHHFSDASQQGYGAVSYLRFLDDKDAIHCSFVMGKARTAPLKTVTIPRLELSAAVVASRLDKILRKEIDIPVDESVFWTDSTCVISYIQNNDKRFHTFVANRIAIIQDATSPFQWRYVNSEGNPADDTSRGLTVDSIIFKNRWINGPDFLWEPESRWPVQPVAQMSDDDPEIKRDSQALLSLTNTGTIFINQVLEYFSSWYRLKKFVAWILRYLEKLKQSSKRRKEGLALVQDSPEERSFDPLSVDEINKAEKEILKFIQRQSFGEELSRLDEQEEVNESNDLKSAKERKPQIKKSSAIHRLDPMKLGGLLYVGGRLRQASIPYPAKHQIILPNRHHVVDLIVRYYHLMSGHSGLEHGSGKVLDSQSKDGCKEGCYRLLRLQKKASPARKAENGRPAHRPGDACKSALYVCRN
mgnify:CR=1 FL=1